jgi:hypothetical protein
MTTLRATIKGGRLELDVPQDWPDGTEVEIHPIAGRRGAPGRCRRKSMSPGGARVNSQGRHPPLDGDRRNRP